MSVHATAELWISGARFADTAGAGPAALDDLVLRWGRDNRLDQPDPAQLTVTVLDKGQGPGRWDGLLNLGADVGVWVAVNGARVCTFAGRITDIVAQFDPDRGGTEVKVAAADPLADKANRFVGQEPWASEFWWQRAHRITGANGADWDIIPQPPSGVVVSRMDVDRQSQANLLTELAVTGGAIIFPAAYPDGRMLLIAQSPFGRASLLVLAEGDDGLWRPMSGAGKGAFELPADQVWRDPVDWSRTVVDMVTRVTCRYLDQTTTPGTTERNVMVVDTAAETTWGARGLSLGTILTTSTDATTLANNVLARNKASGAYRARGLVLDLDHADPALASLAVRLLDSSARTGTAILLTDLPDWSPAAAAAGSYVEGGTYTFTDGRWVLSLQTTAAAGAGESITYQQCPYPVPAYNQFAPDVAYIDLVGVGPPSYTAWEELTGAWQDIPAETSWSEL